MRFKCSAYITSSKNRNQFQQKVCPFCVYSNQYLIRDVKSSRGDLLEKTHLKDECKKNASAKEDGIINI